MGRRRTAVRRSLPALVAVLAALAAPALASASDSRAGSSGDQLFYGSAVEQDITPFTVEAGEPATPGKAQQCTTGVDETATEMERTAWYRVKGTGGKISLSAVPATSTGFDTVLAVYEVGASTPLACSDDVSLLNSSSRINGLATTNAKSYEVQVGTIKEFECFFACVVSLLATNEQAPPGDQRAAPVPLGSSAASNSDFATEEPGEVLACTEEGIAHNYGKTVWFDYRPSEYGTATIRTTGSLDTVATLYQAGSQAPLACNDDEVKGKVTTSLLTVGTSPGQDYLLQVGGFLGSHGPFGVAVDFAPNKDVDGDGYQASRFGGADCDDNDPAIRPGALDIPGNAVDENCDGVVAPLARLSPDITIVFSVGRKSTRISKLTVSKAQVGATVRLICRPRKKGCAFRSKSTPVRSPKALDLSNAVKRLALKPGARFEVRVAKAGAIGSVSRFKVRKGKQPIRTTLCLPPGGKTPKACT
jgi:hypothetical protein